MIHYMGTIPMYDNETIDTMCIKLVVDDFGLYLMVLYFTSDFRSNGGRFIMELFSFIQYDSKIIKE